MSDKSESQGKQVASSHVLTKEPSSRLRSGRLSQRPHESRLKNAPPPNSIRYYRQRAGMSLEVLGSCLGVSRETIRHLEERDTWLGADRAAEIGKALGVPKEVLGFSDAPNAYAWAAKAIPVVGSVIANDEVCYSETGCRMAGGAHLPADAVALDIRHGKLRGWLLFYRNVARQPMSQDVLERQGFAQKFIVNLRNGTTWWRHIKPASTRSLFHLNSPYLCSIQDVEISWFPRLWDSKLRSSNFQRALDEWLLHGTLSS